LDLDENDESIRQLRNVAQPDHDTTEAIARVYAEIVRSSYRIPKLIDASKADEKTL